MYKLQPTKQKEFTMKNEQITMLPLKTLPDPNWAEYYSDKSDAFLAKSWRAYREYMCKYYSTATESRYEVDYLTMDAHRILLIAIENEMENRAEERRG